MTDAPVPPPPILEFVGVERSFDDGRVVALRGVDLRIAAGETVAIVGRSGSGKSTLLNLAAGLDRADHGQVLIDGRPVASADEWARRRAGDIGIVFQHCCLLPRLTAAENVEMAMPALTRPERRARARALLEEVGLSAAIDRVQDVLSGGERQRVAIARALVNRPRLLLADEPTGSLDTETGSLIVRLMRDLVIRRGAALVLVTHETDVAACCRRRVLIRDGRVAEDVLVAAGDAPAP